MGGKGNIKDFETDLEQCFQDPNISSKEVNRILSAIHRNNDFIDLLYDSILEKKIHLNGLSYTYMISSYLKNKKLLNAYSIFIQAYFEGVLLDINIINSLYIQCKIARVGVEFIKQYTRKHYKHQIDKLLKKVPEQKKTSSKVFIMKKQENPQDGTIIYTPSIADFNERKSKVQSAKSDHEKMTKRMEKANKFLNMTDEERQNQFTQSMNKHFTNYMKALQKHKDDSMFDIRKDKWKFDYVVEFNLLDEGDYPLEE